MGILDIFKRKYKVNPKNNVPEFVYGIPDVNKYNIDPDENMPREVYGIPNPSKYDVKPEENIPEKVYGIKVVNRNQEDKKCKKCGCVLKKYIYGKVTGDIDRSKYALGGCIISEDNPVYRCPNCNEDLDINLEPIKESLEQVINGCVGNDPFWNKMLKEYFEKEISYDEETAVKLLKSVIKDKEIFNEFTKYLVSKNYDIENPVKVDGITAKDLANKNPKKNAIEIYAMLSKFKNKQ